MIFHEDSIAENNIRYVPYEVKEVTIKTGFGVMLILMGDYLFSSGYMLYSLLTGYLGFNWLYKCQMYMGNAIIRMELNEDGESVNMYYKTGGSINVKIKNIKKLRHEKELVQTFEEPYLFPVEVSDSKSKKTCYFYGNGQSAIKNGEIFRAIINGQSISV